MKKTKRSLLLIFSVFLLLSVVIVILFETDTLLPGTLAADKQSEFILATILELLTLGAIFMGLRLFKFKTVHEDLTTRKAPALMKWGSVRLLLLELPMLCNTLLYYIYMNTTFGYMAIILALCLPFVYPSEGRCKAETEA